MKQISIYFGKQQDGVLGSYADIVKLAPVSEENAENVIKDLMDKEANWTIVNLSNGNKYINLKNILWFDVIDVEDKGE